VNTRAIFGETGWLGRAMTSAVSIGVLATARPDPRWVWVVLGAGLVAFLAGTVLMNYQPYWALGFLAYASIGSALVTGVSGSNALVLVLVPLTDVAVMAHPWRNRPIIAVGISCAGAVAVSAWWWDRSTSWYLTQLMWIAILVAFGLNRRQYEVQARQTAQLLEQTQLAQQEHARAAALDERGRIARDLHDVLAHSLGALTVQLEVAEALLADRNDTAGALDRIRRSRRLAVQGLVEARSAVAALRSDELPALPEALAALAEQHGKDHQVKVTTTTSGTPRPIPSGVTVALLGATRESLTNAGKHAPAQPIQVHLTYDDCLRLAIRNPLTREQDPIPRPATPTENPAGSPRGPGTTTAAPAGPTGDPARPANVPAGPAGDPGNTTAAPAGPTGDPARPTDGPAGPAADPGNTTVHPAGPTGGPARPAGDPGNTTAGPPEPAGGPARPAGDPAGPVGGPGSSAGHGARFPEGWERGGLVGGELEGGPNGHGFGLAGMRERLALVGGSLEAGPAGDSWLVVAEVADA
jgi:signal transduction histidine kinase